MLQAPQGLSSSRPTSLITAVKVPIPSPRLRNKTYSANGTTVRRTPSPHASPLPARPVSPKPPSPKPVPPKPAAPKVSPKPMASSRQAARSHSREADDEDEETLSLNQFVLQYSTLLPLQIMVKRGYHGGNERNCIAADDVYNVHFVKHTKVAVLKDRRGATFNIPLNSVVQFAPVFNPTNDPKEALRGFSFEKVSDLMAQKTLPRIVRAMKPHVRVDPQTTIEQYEVFIVHGVVSTGVRKKLLQVYSITCSQQKLLPSDSVGMFTTEPHLTYFYLLEIVEHLLNVLPLEVMVVMNDTDFSDEMPHYLTNEITTLTHMDSETSLIASTHWGKNEQVSEEDHMPVDIPVDLPIEVVVQPCDGANEADLSDHTKTLYEDFDPCRIRLLRSRNIRRGFEKEGMELERPDRIYEIPDIYFQNRSSQSSLEQDSERQTKSKNPRSLSPRFRPRLATPKPPLDPTYSQAYQGLVLHTQLERKTPYAEPDTKHPQETPSRTSPDKLSPTVSERKSPVLPPSRQGSSAKPVYAEAYQPLVTPSHKPQYAEPDTKQQQQQQQKQQQQQQQQQKQQPETPSHSRSPKEKRPTKQSPQPPSPSDKGERDVELLETRVEILEREVYALRAEIAKLKTGQLK